MRKTEGSPTGLGDNFGRLNNWNIPLAKIVDSVPLGAAFGPGAPDPNLDRFHTDKTKLSLIGRLGVRNFWLFDSFDWIDLMRVDLIWFDPLTWLDLIWFDLSDWLCWLDLIWINLKILCTLIWIDLIRLIELILFDLLTALIRFDSVRLINLIDWWIDW